MSFFHLDYTIGIGITPIHANMARGLYRRSGISPCPEDPLRLTQKSLDDKAFDL